MQLFKKKTASPADEQKRAHNKRRIRYGTAASALTVIVVAGVVLLNVIVGVVADRFPVSLDLSADKTFTLSEESVAIAQKIQEPLEIVIFYPESEFSNPTQGIPERDTTIKEFYNALKQYKTHSNNAVSFSFIDPNQEPGKFAAYNAYEVQAGDLLFIYGNRHKKCTINDLYSSDFSEYTTTGKYTFESRVEKVLASNIYSLTSGAERIVQVLAGHEEDTYTIAGLQELYELNGYTFEQMAISSSAQFNEKAEIALIAAPAKDYSKEDIRKVQNWVYNDGNYGRHLLVFLHPTADCPNLFEFLNVEYQIEVMDALITETDPSRIASYAWQEYTLSDIPSSELITDSVSEAKLLTPLARRLTTTLKQADEESIQSMYPVYITHHPKSAQLISLQDYENAAAEEIYAAQESDYPLTSMLTCVIDAYNNNTSTEVRGTVTVSGCAAMAYSDIVKHGNLYNEDLLLELVNSVTDADSDVSISNKMLSTDKLYFSESTAKWLGFGLFTVAIPVLTLVIALIVFLRRKSL